ILSWLVAGAVATHEHRGIGTHPVVAGATGDWRSDEDLVGRFIDERCELGDGLQCGATTLHNVMRSWCQEQGEEAPSQTAFGGELSRRGFERVRFKSGAEKGRSSWLGIDL